MTAKPNDTVNFWWLPALFIVGLIVGGHISGNHARTACVKHCECPHKEVAPPYRDPG
ncbi:MAG: hypothetical protein ACE1ZA_05560 [Pseudomonadales bacterium]